MAYRPEWFPTDQSILDIALDIHMYNTGASEYPHETYEKLRQYAQYALDNWQEPTKDFDLAVKQLLRIVLTEKKWNEH